MTLPELRRAYVAAVETPVRAEALERNLRASGLPDVSPTALGYLAAALALRARYAGNPLQKLGFLQKAQSTFRQAVHAAEADPEIRLLRFAVQRAIPPFLNMSNDMAADTRVVIDQRAALQPHGIEPGVVREMLTFVADSGLCTAEEARALLAGQP